MRLNLRLKGTAEQLILDMCEQNNIEPKDIILDALALYNVAVKQAREGRAVAYERSDGQYCQFTTPTLEALGNTAAASSAVENNNQVASAG